MPKDIQKKGKCLYCGKIFIKKQNHQLRCSLICTRKYETLYNSLENWKKQKPIKCCICGAEFFKSSSRSQVLTKCCSKICGKINNRMLRAKKLGSVYKQEKKCPVCGKLFIKHGKQKCCSHACYDKSEPVRNYKKMAVKRHVDNLADYYVRGFIKRKTDIKTDEITPKLLELKREQIKLKRTLKQLTHKERGYEQNIGPY